LGFDLPLGSTLMQARAADMPGTVSSLQTLCCIAGRGGTLWRRKAAC
jgi:hypothetical protein